MRTISIMSIYIFNEPTFFHYQVGRFKQSLFLTRLVPVFLSNILKVETEKVLLVFSEKEFRLCFIYPVYIFLRIESPMRFFFYQNE